MGQAQAASPVDPLLAGGGRLRIRRHGRRQLEVKVEYPAESVTRRRERWSLEMWFVLPEAIGIDPGSYDADTFHADLRSRSRLLTPRVPLDALFVRDGVGSPLASLQAVLDRARPTRPTPGDRRVIRSETRLLVSVLKSALRDELAELAALDDGAAQDRGAALDDGAVMERIAHLSSGLADFISRWRGLREALKVLKVKRKARWALDFGDEAISLLVEQAALELVEHLELRVGRGAADELRGPLLDLARSERSRREQAGWRSVVSDVVDPVVDDGYVDQRRLLKKYVASELLLRRTRSRRDGLLRQGALAFAAGLAMTWAVVAQIVMLVSLDLQLRQGMSASVVVVFAALAVVAYMLKDRIKSTTGPALAKRLSERQSLLWLDGARKPVGRHHEHMGFVAPPEMPDEVRRLWRETLRNSLLRSSSHDVLHYARTIEVYPSRALAVFPRFDGVVDLLRLDLDRWLGTLSAASHDVLVIGRDGELVRRKLPGRYVADLLVRLARDGGEDDAVVQQVRLVLGRGGLERVEPVG